MAVPNGTWFVHLHRTEGTPVVRRARAAGIALATLVVTALVALPAAAADEAEAATGFGSGQWDGLLLTAVVGAILGVLMFALHDPGGIPKADGHH